MITNIVLENFKCFHEVEVNPRLITVFVGPNGTGKSSVLQALALLKQSVNGVDLTSHGSLVDLETTPTFQLEDATLRIGFSGADAIPGPESMKIGAEVRYSYLFESNRSDGSVHWGSFSLSPNGGSVSIEFLNKATEPRELSVPGVHIRVTRANAVGHVAQRVKDLSVQDQPLRESIERYVFNAPARTLDGLRFVSAARGLVRASYRLGDARITDISPIGGLSGQEEQVATNLGYARELEATISKWSREVTGVGIRGKTVPVRSISVESLTVQGAVNMVAEGFGANSLVQLFMQLADADRGATVLIEEPEIHLHPKAQADLASLLAEVSKAESKQLIMTTHSEHIVGRLLTLVAEKKLSADELAIYAFQKDEEGVCTAGELEVTDDGRVVGGLKDFFEADLAELDRFIRAMQPSE